MLATENTAVEATLLRLRDRVQEAERDLASIPAFKRGSQFEIDRINELSGLRASLARMLSK